MFFVVALISKRLCFLLRCVVSDVGGDGGWPQNDEMSWRKCVVSSFNVNDCIFSFGRKFTAIKIGSGGVSNILQR